ncbi:MAG TPA: hypothetical protein VN915_15465 [Elusimicrobiota bacterium]|nr:hypothetical protein [Elusimicrobiota bacterium]
MTNAKGRSVRALAAGLGLLVLLAASAPAELSAVSSGRKSSTSVQTPESAISDWPSLPQATARLLIAKYGEPNTFDDGSLVWYDNGEWRKTVVYRKAPESFMGLHSRDILQQTVAYAVPDSKIGDLKTFDDRIKYDKSSGEISSISESENLNYLALNLADEIVSDRRSPQEARDFYRKTTKFAQSGKSSAYTQGLLFRPIQKPQQVPGEEPTPRIPGEEPPSRGGPIEPPAP